ncbi:hypothetical protein [Streptomyces sp. NPDC001389]|uniref:hypothetical protein n=1 Tax=Streptomyces sp. NPDC001389 TaxID=3364569 RepID=UPI0036923CA4
MSNPTRRRLTELEHDRAWHAIEGLNWEAGPDPDTVLNAVLAALGIDPPGMDEMAASLRRDDFGDDEIAEILQAGGEHPDDEALCGHCGVPRGSHHHPWTSTPDVIANVPWNNAENHTP